MPCEYDVTRFKQVFRNFRPGGILQVCIVSVQPSERVFLIDRTLRIDKVAMVPRGKHEKVVNLGRRQAGAFEFYCQ